MSLTAELSDNNIRQHLNDFWMEVSPTPNGLFLVAAPNGTWAFPAIEDVIDFVAVSLRCNRSFQKLSEKKK